MVSAEDKHFYEHGGVDVGATVRALVDDLRSGEVVQGGSTITQQYVKNAFTNGERTIGRKIQEAILASQLDRQLDKDTILYRYLSTIYFGSGSYGVGAAAQTYFRMPVSQLGLSEAALIAGVIPSPSKYSPLVDPAAAEQRRRFVLDEMLDQGRISQAAHDRDAPGTDLVGGQRPAPRPRDGRVSARAGTVDAAVVHRLRPLVARDAPARLPVARLPTARQRRLARRDDPRPAAAAGRGEEVATTMGKNDVELQMSLVSVEPPTGFVKAMVGGRDWGFSQVNTALGPPTARLVVQALRPRDRVRGGHPAVEGVLGRAVAPAGRDDDPELRRRVFGRLDLRHATWHSVNGVYARLVLDAGVDKTMAMAQRLGADMPPYDPAVYGASVALGVIDVSPLQMASAYGVFADHGKRAPPTPVLQVFDRDGNVIIDNTHAADQAQPVVSDVVADNVTDVLRGRADARAPRQERDWAHSRPRARRVQRKMPPTPGSWATHPRCRRRCGWDICTVVPDLRAACMASTACARSRAGRSLLRPGSTT